MIERKGNYVYKTAEVLNADWREKFASIMEYMHFPAFIKFIPNGYVTKYIDGYDLQEDKPFNYRHDIVRAYPLNDTQRQGVIKILKDVVFSGLKTGYILGDFTKRNIIIKSDTPYLIDYDVIIEEFNEDYIRIYQTMLDYLQIEYEFKGNLKELHERLS